MVTLWVTTHTGLVAPIEPCSKAWRWSRRGVQLNAPRAAPLLGRWPNHATLRWRVATFVCRVATRQAGNFLGGTLCLA